MRLLIYTGKGGTGKTVNSCSTAVKLADYGYKTLILSSDPAHTLSDAFNVKDIRNDPIEVIENLYALQVDPVIEMGKHFKSLIQYFASIYLSKGLDETLAYEISMLPGMTQLFSLLKVEESFRNSHYDAIVLDMPASGEALRYLYFPKLVGSIGRKFAGISGVFNQMAKMFQPFFGFHNFSTNISSPPMNVLQSESNLLSRLDSLSKIIINSDITSIRLVANPDAFSIENAKRALMSANLYGINVDLVIVNKIMPLNSMDNYFANWGKLQNTKVQEARSNFFPLPIKEIQLYEKELRGLEMLRINGNRLFGTEDPIKVFYTEKIFEFVNEKSSLYITMRVPFSEKDDYEIEYLGDQLIIKVKTLTGILVNIIPLPAAVTGMKLSEAKLIASKLYIFFKKY